MSEFLLSALRFESRADENLRVLLAKWLVSWIVPGVVFVVAVFLIFGDVAGALAIIPGLALFDLVVLLVARTGLRRSGRHLA